VLRIAPAPMNDVLKEQFEYLMSHAKRCEVGDCSDCQRWTRIEYLLCRPFKQLRKPRWMTSKTSR
jgi:hypothetical protein